MVVAAAPKLGPTQEKVLRAALVHGEIRTSSTGEQVSANLLNGRRLLDRDRHDGNLFRPTAKAFETFPSWRDTLPEAGDSAPDGPLSDINVVMLDVSSIYVGSRLRVVDPLVVEKLAVSFLERGMRTPLTVRAMPDGRYRLSAGAHRLATVQKLAWDKVACFVRDSDDTEDELWEIDENLCRADLTPADRAIFVRRRKELYLLMHPETAHGGDRASRQLGDLKEETRFTAATAEATGRSERSLQRDAERGEKINDRALRLLRGTRHNTGAMLDRLKALRDDLQLAYVEELIAEDRRKQAESKVIRTHNLKMRRAVRTGLIAAIAGQGKSTPGEWPLAAYPVGYADPPWEQEAYSDETGQDKGLPYPAMSLDDIKAMCAGPLSPFTRDAILFLWVPANRVDDGVDVLRAWGFDFVSCIVWDKVHIGMGRWVRDRHELVLIGKRGDFPGLDEGSQPQSLFSEVKTQHSRKPVKMAADIDRLFPELPKLELFQRKQSLAPDDPRLKGNWRFWGNESGEGAE